MKERDEVIDILRGFAILAVLFGHAIQRGLIYDYNKTIMWKVIYSFHMPLFVFLSGFTLYMSTPIYNSKWLKNKCSRLMVPLIFWTIIVELMSDFKFTGLKPFTAFPNTVSEFIKRTVLHPDWAFWFLWIIFVFMMIFFINDKLTRKLKNVQRYQILFFALVEVIIIAILKLTKKDVFGLIQIQYYFPVFICGYFASKYKSYIYKYLKYAVLPAAILWSLLFYSSINEDRIQKYILALSAIIVIYYFVTLLQKYLRWLTYFGKISLELYTCESICLNIGFYNGYTRVISIFITATVCSILLSKILKISKYTNYLAFGTYKSETKL